MRMCGRVFVAVLLLGAMMPVVAQDSHSAKPKDCAGLISDDGQSFTCEKDKKVWKVSNPAVLKDMEGKHAKLNFRVNSGDEVLVLSASLAQQQPQQAANGSTTPH